jgi:hypothetical protein
VRWSLLWVLATVLGLALGLPGVRQAHADSDAGLGVEGALAEITADPGQKVEHQMLVSLGAGAAAPMQIVVEARGLGEGPDGATLALDAADDTSPFSARGLIAAIEPEHFTLAPGGVQAVTATLAVPSDLTSGIRYADIYISSVPAAGGKSVGSVVALHVPVLLTIASSTFSTLASILSIDAGAPASGQPIGVTTVVQNRGDHHFRADNQVTIAEPDGASLGTVSVPLTGSSLLPLARHAYRASVTVRAGQILPAGTYTVDSRVVLQDGEVFDERRATFVVPPSSSSSAGSSTGGGSGSSAGGGSGSSAGGGSGSSRPGPVPTAVLPALPTATGEPLASGLVVAAVGLEPTATDAPVSSALSPTDEPLPESSAASPTDEPLPEPTTPSSAADDEQPQPPIARAAAPAAPPSRATVPVAIAAGGSSSPRSSETVTPAAFAASTSTPLPPVAALLTPTATHPVPKNEAPVVAVAGARASTTSAPATADAASPFAWWTLLAALVAGLVSVAATLFIGTRRRPAQASVGRTATRTLTSQGHADRRRAAGH